MPQDFESCRRRGGEIRTVKPNDDAYIHICIDPDPKNIGPRSGRRKTYAGEVHHRGEPRNSNKPDKKARDKVYIGPRGGRYIWRNGKKKYV
jgi:hypothetical protein